MLNFRCTDDRLQGFADMRREFKVQGFADMRRNSRCKVLRLAAKTLAPE